MSTSPYTLKENRYSSHSTILRLLPGEGQGRSLLDLGCAKGYLSQILAQRGYEVTAVERTHPQLSGIRFIRADLDGGLPPLGEQFDYVLVADLLEHLRDPAALLKEIRTALKPNGRVLLSLPNSGNLYFRLVVLAGRFPKQDKGLFDRTHIHFFTWRGWLDLLEQAHYEVRLAIPTAIPIGLTLPRWDHSAPIRAAESLSYLLARLRKQLFAYQFVVEAVANQ